MTVVAPTSGNILAESKESTTGNETVLSSALCQIPPSALTGFGFHFARSTTNMVNGMNPPIDNNNEPQEDLMVNNVRNVNKSVLPPNTIVERKYSLCIIIPEKLKLVHGGKGHLA
jgi:hypothetical protein